MREASLLGRARAVCSCSAHGALRAARLFRGSLSGLPPVIVHLPIFCGMHPAAVRQAAVYLDFISEWLGWLLQVSPGVSGRAVHLWMQVAWLPNPTARPFFCSREGLTICILRCSSRCAHCSCTSASRAGVAAARHQVYSNPNINRRCVGARAHAYISSSTPLDHHGRARSRLNILPMQGRCPVSSRRGGSDVRLLTGRSTGNHRFAASEGAQEPPQPSNSVPNQPYSSPACPPARSHHPRRVAGASMRREAGADGMGSTAYLSEMATDAVCTAAGLKTARQGCSRPVHSNTTNIVTTPSY